MCCCQTLLLAAGLPTAASLPALPVVAGPGNLLMAINLFRSSARLTMRAWNVANVVAMAALTAGSWMSAAASVTWC